MQIIDSQIRDLVWEIDGAKTCVTALDMKIRKLVGLLKASCARPEVGEDFRRYETAEAIMGRYPKDARGYAVSFDPLTQEDEFFETWCRFGIVVGKGVVWPDDRAHAIARIHAIVRDMSEGRCDLDRPETWDKIPTDDSGVPILSRGFFEFAHDESVATLRQSVRVYLHNVLIWRRADLWTTFDRLGVKLPGHGESRALPLHVDQNPNVHPLFRTVQGVLALDDCPVERGTFLGVPGSRKHFAEYAPMAKNQGEYVELDLHYPIAGVLEDNRQAIALRGGDMVSWDSRTTHANTENVSKLTRYVAYISSGIAREDNEQAIKSRQEGFRTGLGSNVRDAYMHASKPPRFTDAEAVSRVRKAENLTLLGRLLYGIDGSDRYAAL
jgi:hypothetical protein